jgi:hypothetical protein
MFFVYQWEDPDNGKSKIGVCFCKVDETTEYSDWRSASVASSNSYNCTSPDISVHKRQAYVAYMSDRNGNQDIYVATSTGGGMWQRYQVTDSIDDEMYPAISGKGNEATIIFMRNGNLYKTSTEDTGRTWSTPELVNDIPNTIVEDFHYTDIKGTYGVWTDNRNDNDDIYFEEVGLSSILVIGEITGGFGLKVTISNVGNAPAENVEWSIDLEGGIVLLGSHTENIENIEAESSITINSGFGFGFGRVSIIVTVGDISETASGFMLGPFILNVQ